MMGKIPLKTAIGLDRAGAQVVDTGHRDLPMVTFHRHRGPAVDASAYVQSMNTRCELAGPEGTWQVVLKRRVVAVDGAHLPDMAWGDLVAPGDWVTLGFDDTHHRWPVMLGNVDRVHVSVQATAGKRVETYTVEGRDHGKALTTTDILILPQLAAPAGFDPAVDLLPYFRSLDRVFKSGALITPDEVVPALLYFFLGTETRQGFEREAAPMWRLPPSIYVYRSDRPEGDVRAVAGAPLGDLLEVATEPLDGRILLGETFSVPSGGQKLWQALADYANPEICEFYVDLLPVGFSGRATSPEDYTESEDGSTVMVPTVVLRQRPFPSEARLKARLAGYQVRSAASGTERWSRLPWTEIDERMLMSEDLSRSDGERFNFWLTLAPAAYGSNPYTLALGAGRGLLPLLDNASAEAYGWRRREISSPFLPTNPEVPTGDGYLFTSLLRDWYAHNPELWSGSLRLAHMLPGVRVGEKLHVRRNDGAIRETFYVEGVEHDWQASPGGALTGTTTLTVTRGSTKALGGYQTLQLDVDVDALDDVVV